MEYMNRLVIEVHKIHLLATYVLFWNKKMVIHVVTCIKVLLGIEEIYWKCLYKDIISKWVAILNALNIINLCNVNKCKISFQSSSSIELSMVSEIKETLEFGETGYSLWAHSGWNVTDITRNQFVMQYFDYMIQQ